MPATGGWDDTTQGWESATLGWGSGGTPAATHGRHLWITLPYGGPTSHLLDMAQAAGVAGVRWGMEFPDYMSTPDSTSSYGTLDLSPLAAQIAAVHARTTPWGTPMGVTLTVMGTPRSLNPNAGSADPASGGNWHWFPTTSGGRTTYAGLTVQVANLLTPGLDRIQLANETNNWHFNHNGAATMPSPMVVGASAATVAQLQAEQVLAVRASGPSGLKILGGSTMLWGDFRNPADQALRLTAPDWAADMIAGDARLKTTARFDAWAGHAYTGTTSPLDGWQVVNGVTSITSDYGWAMPQLLSLRDTVWFLGLTEPGGSPIPFAITEWGYPNAGTGYSESTQLSSVQQALYAFEIFKNEGWLTYGSYLFTIDNSTGENLNLWRDVAPYDPYTAGTYFTTWAHTDEPPPSTPGTIAPVAAFQINPNPVYTGNVASFIDQSANGPTTWAWNFGDGSGTFTAQNPTHTYSAPGTYTVTLTATNTAGSSTATQTITVSPFVVVTPPVDPDALDVLVEIGVPPTAVTAPTAFQIGDDVTGRIGSGGKLAGRYVWIPITSDVVSIDIDRGRSRALDRTDAGTANIVVRDDNPTTARQYDAQNWLSKFFPYLGPRARVRVTVDGTRIFGGDITELPSSEAFGNQVITTINAVEISNRLTKKITYRPEAVHTAGKRIARILEEAGWEDDSYLFPGVYTYAAQGTVFEGSAWDLIQDIAYAEGGMAYISNQGNSLNFIDRDHMHGPNSGSMELLSDLQTGEVPYDGVSRTSGMDMVYNAVTFKSVTDDKLIASNRDPVSIGEFGEIPLEVTSPIGGTTPAFTKFLMQYRVDQMLRDFKRPTPRFQTVAVEAAKLGKQTRRPFVLGQEVGHVVTAERHPPGSGWPATVSQVCVIIGMSHSIVPGSCVTTFTLTPKLAPA